MGRSQEMKEVVLQIRPVTLGYRDFCYRDISYIRLPKNYDFSNLDVESKGKQKWRQILFTFFLHLYRNWKVDKILIKKLFTRIF